MLVILFFTGLFANLPQPVLAALILIASAGLINIASLRRIARISKRELAIAFVSMLFVLTVGMLAGIIIGVLLSILDMLNRVSYPHITILGKLPNKEQYVDVTLHPEAVQVPDVLICRVDASIIFANAKTVKRQLLNMVDKISRPARLVVLDMAPTPILDITGYDMLEELNQELSERGIALRLANVSGQLRNVMEKAGFAEKYGRVPQNRTIAEVLEEWKSGSGG